MPDRTRSRVLLLLAVAASGVFSYSTCAVAQVATTYSYDGSNRLIQALASNGSGVQYQYDAAGNVRALTPVTPQALGSGSVDTVSWSTPGEAQMLAFTVTAGQPLALSAANLTTNPPGAAVTVNVYNAVGVLVGSFSTASGSLDLSSVPAGQYTAIVVPASGSTGSLQVSLTASNGTASGDTDLPLPSWSIFALGLGLLGILQWSQRRRAA